MGSGGEGRAEGLVAGGAAAVAGGSLESTKCSS